MDAADFGESEPVTICTVRFLVSAGAGVPETPDGSAVGDSAATGLVTATSVTGGGKVPAALGCGCCMLIYRTTTSTITSKAKAPFNTGSRFLLTAAESSTVTDSGSSSAP